MAWKSSETAEISLPFFSVYEVTELILCRLILTAYREESKHRVVLTADLFKIRKTDLLFTVEFKCFSYFQYLFPALSQEVKVYGNTAQKKEPNTAKCDIINL